MGPDEEPGDPLADLDQAMAEMRTVAQMLAAHYREMMRAGFNPQQALALTVGYQAAVLGQ